jgi:hypothetical protein
MRGFWNKMGENYLRGINVGTLHVSYSVGTQ